MIDQEKLTKRLQVYALMREEGYLNDAMTLNVLDGAARHHSCSEKEVYALFDSVVSSLDFDSSHLGMIIELKT